MHPDRRTKTRRQCRAEATLLGMSYSLSAHVYLISSVRGGASELFCAETMQPLDILEAHKRASEYSAYLAAEASK